MKKILFLLLLTVASYGQTYQNPTFGTVKTMTAPTVTTTPHLGTVEANGTISKITPENLPISTATQTAIDLKANKDSGLLLGGGLSINADPTKYDLATGEGYVTNSLTGVVHHISWGTQTALTTPYRTTSVATYVLMADAGGGFGTIVTQNTAPTPQQYRTHIYLGKLAHTTFTNILFAVSEPSRMFDLAGQVSDVNLTLGARNISGNVITYNGANLNINASAGQMYRAGANYLNDRNSPSITTESAFTAGTFRNKFRNGSGGWTAVNTSVIDPNFYDDGTGILAAVPNNKWTIKVLWRFGGTGTIHCDYGQAVYDSKADAILAIDKAITIEDPENVRDAAKRGWLVVKKGATALNNLTDAEFFKAGKDGERIAGGSSTATLQVAYDNSITPQITTSTGGGALTIKNGSASDSNNIFQGQNIAGSNTFSVTGAGTLTANNLKVADQTISSKTNILRQDCGSDWYKLYSYFTTVDMSEMVFEVGDNAQSFDTNGQRFRFHYDASNSGTEKDPFIIDYNKITASTDFDISGNVTIGSSTSDAKVSINAGVASSSMSTLSLTQGSNPYGQITSTDASHGLVLRGYPSSGLTDNYSVTPTDIMSFYDFGGEFRFYKKNGTLTLQGKIDDNGYTGGATLTGTPTAPTATAGTNTTQIATTAFVQDAISSGTFTPTITNGGNSSSAALVRASYIKTGNIVTAYYTISTTSTSPTAFVTVNATLPVNRTNSTSLDVGTGSAWVNTGGVTYVPVLGQSVSTTSINLSFKPTASVSCYLTASIQYSITE